MNVYRKINRKEIQFDFLCMGINEGHYDKEILELGGRIFRIKPPLETGYAKHIKEIRKIIRENGPYKVVHSPTQFHSGIVCLAAYFEKVPIRIVHSHSAGIKDNTIKRGIYNFVCRKLINIFSTCKVACGEKARDLLFGKSKKSKSQVLILPNGIDINNYINIDLREVSELRKSLAIDKSTLVIGNVGRFEKVKNHEFFIELAKYYKEKNTKVKIILVGDGTLKSDIESLIRKEKLQEYFVLTGIRNDIPILMNSFDVFVLPSFYEGFPVVMVEALACGKKCVISDTISKEVEIIEDSVKFVSLNDDMEKWVEEIDKQSRGYIDKDTRRKILIEKGFSIDDTVEILTKIYTKEGKNEK